jgi:hypothetical protein
VVRFAIFGEKVAVGGRILGSADHELTSWRNGNALDSRPKDWGFDSLRGHSFCFFCLHVVVVVIFNLVVEHTLCL